MNILMIEDDNYKAASLEEFLLGRVPGAQITFAPSLVDAIEAIEVSLYSLVLIDMAIPSHPIIPGEGSPMSLLAGGLEVLMEIQSLGRHDPCVIITQYPEIEISGIYYSLADSREQLKLELGCKVLDCIEYSEGSDQWKLALGEVLKTYENISS